MAEKQTGSALAGARAGGRKAGKQKPLSIVAASNIQPAEIVAFPRRFKFPLPPDCIRPAYYHCFVFPHEGRWSFFECGESGGGGEDHLTKRAALAMAIESVLEHGATLEILNRCWFCEDCA